MGKYVVGIDEVGRGPLAGPVTVCVVACDFSLYKKLSRTNKLPPLGKDSKKLSSAEREKFAKFLKSQAVVGKDKFKISIVHVSNASIDLEGISRVIRRAVGKGIAKLGLSPACNILLDGSLSAPPEFKKQKTIIKGDEKEKIIAWASILAKVSRDKLMIRLHKKYPEYGFHSHKGYGTAIHLRAISVHGLSSIHRKSFCSRFIGEKGEM